MDHNFKNKREVGIRVTLKESVFKSKSGKDSMKAVVRRAGIYKRLKPRL